MALQILENQPIIFNPEEDCPECDTAKYCQHFGPDDTLQFQEKQLPCKQVDLCDFDAISEGCIGENIITNGGFNADLSGWGGNWIWDAGVASSSTSTTNLYQDLTGLVTAGAPYCLTFTVTFGAITAECGCEFPRLDVIFGGGNIVATITESGTYTICGNWSSIPADVLAFAVFPCCATIDNVSLCAAKYCWGLDSNITLSNGTICHTQGFESTISQSDVLNIGGYYKTVIKVSTMTQGDIEITDFGTITDNGVFEFWATPTAADLTLILSADFDGCIEYIKVYQLKNDFMAGLIIEEPYSLVADLTPYITYYKDWVTMIVKLSVLQIAYGCYKVALFNTCCTDCIDYYEPCYNVDGNYDDTPGHQEGHYYYRDDGTIVQSIGGNPVVVECESGVVQVGISPTCLSYNSETQKWEPIDCPTICSICNGDFSHIQIDPLVCWERETDGNVNNQIILGHWDIYFNDDNSAVAFIKQEVSLCKNRRYKVSFDYESAIDFNWGASLPNGNGGVSFLGSGSLEDGEGSVEFTFSTCLDDIYLVEPLQLLLSISNGLGAVGNVVVDNVKMYQLPVDMEEDCPDYISNCISYKQEVTCYDRLLMGYSETPAFGFEFTNSGFRLQLRVPFALHKSGYDDEISQYVFSDGTRELSFSQSEKFKTVSINQVDEISHDTIDKIRLMKHFYIGDSANVLTEYIAKKGDYTPEWKGIIRTSNAKFEVSKKGTIGFMTNCE